MKYLCIDLKSFYASVECIERNLDPLTTPLAVCDITRGDGAIFLAATPCLKNMGVGSRARLYEVKSYIRKKIIFAKPRMKKYIEYSTKVYKTYLSMFSKEDIYVYSIDEVFIDVTTYLTYYNLSVEELALRVVNEVKKNTGLICCIGAGDNMFLSKVSLDILAKKSPNGVCYLSLDKFKDVIWKHEPITDIWRIGPGTQRRLYKYNIKTLGEVANCDIRVLEHEFGILSQELYEHANGIDTTTIKEIKEYKPINKSINHSQILFEDYSKEDALTVLLEMTDVTVLKLIEQGLKTTNISIDIGYSKILQLSFHKSITIRSTNSYKVISREVKDAYIDFVDELPIRKLSITLGGLSRGNIHQLDLFEEDNTKEVTLFNTINDIKGKFGKNAVNKAFSYTEEGNQVERNKLVGGHNGE